ncbi:MAG TPA: hypothetical protein VGG54_34930 [Trebonia sp.]
MTEAVVQSTTIKILRTLANPTSGSARVAGHDLPRQRDTAPRDHQVQE